MQYKQKIVSEFVKKDEKYCQKSIKSNIIDSESQKRSFYMNDSLRHDVAVYMYAFIGNTRYRNEDYHDSLVKKYGRKAVRDMIADISKNGKFSDALNNVSNNSKEVESKNAAA